MDGKYFCYVVYRKHRKEITCQKHVRKTRETECTRKHHQLYMHYIELLFSSENDLDCHNCFTLGEKYAGQVAREKCKMANGKKSLVVQCHQTTL